MFLVSPYLFPFLVLNRYFLVYYFHSLVISFTISFNHYLTGCLRITINILIYNNLVQSNTDIISIVYILLLYISIPLPICMLLLPQNTSLHVVFPLMQIYNYCFLQLSFKSYREKGVISQQYNNTGF